MSKSWTTRPQRPTEPSNAYVFATTKEFKDKIKQGGFLEWAEFLGDLYGTPWPEIGPEKDLLLEIDIQGASQVLQRHGDSAVMFFLVAPSAKIQMERLKKRGDDPSHIAKRLAIADKEVQIGKSLAQHLVVNEDLDETVHQISRIIQSYREKPKG